MGRRSSGKPSAKRGSAGRADCLPRGKPFGAPAGAYSLPQEGNDAPTTARIGTCRPMGRSHFSFDGERKVCKRKPAARRLREKALCCPFLKEGVRNVARSIVGRPTFTFVRARAHSFPLSKRARLFPSAAYRRSAPPQSAAGILIPCGLGRLPWLGGFAASRNEGLCSPAVGVGQAYPLRVGMTHVAWRFCSVKE